MGTLPAKGVSEAGKRAVRRVPARVLGDVGFAGVGLVFVVLLGCVFNADGVFFSRAIHADALWQNAAFCVLACGMTAVILSGGIDLSVGSVSALSGVVFARLALAEGAHGPMPIIAAVGAGCACGCLTGCVIAFLRIQPFVATLAMMAFARGLAKWMCDGKVITRYPYPDIVESINSKASVAGLDISAHVIVFVAAGVVMLALLRGTTFGLRVYAVGDNEQAARYAGVNARLVKVVVYSLSGLFAGIGGVLMAALARQGNPDEAAGAELTAIAMVVVGGTSLSGGRGGMVLTALGALTIVYLRKILDINSVETHMQLMITGGIIVLAVLARSLRRG